MDDDDMRMREDPIDLSPLDPARDAARWSDMLASVAARARARHAANLRARSLSRELVRRGAPAFALAAAAAAIVWLARPKPRVLSETDASAASSSDPIDVLSSWALDGSAGGSIDPRELLLTGSSDSGGGDHVAR